MNEKKRKEIKEIKIPRSYEEYLLLTEKEELALMKQETEKERKRINKIKASALSKLTKEEIAVLWKE